VTGLRVAFAGTPEFALPPLRALAASRHRIVGILTQPDRAAGRGRRLAPSPVRQEALARAWPVAQPKSLKAVEAVDELRSWRPDVLVVVAYGLILPVTVLTLPRLGCVNVHASLLPRWRGAAPIQRAILEGDRESGVTIMQMDAGLDTGPILLQRRESIDRETTASRLHDRLAVLGAEALLEALDGLVTGTLEPRPQPDAGACYAHKIDKSEGLIDWNREAPAIARQVRAFDLWPVAETRLAGEQLRIWRAEALEEGTRREPADPRSDAAPAAGTVLGLRDDALLVVCGSGVLAIHELQRAGRRRMTPRELASGCPLDGARLG